MLAITWCWLLLAPALAKAAVLLKTKEFQADPGYELENQDLNGTYQGDIVLDEHQEGNMDRTWNSDPSYRWPGGVLPYAFAYGSSFSTEEKRKIVSAMAEIEQKSGGCVSFVERTNQEHYVRITDHSDDGCKAAIGRYQNGAQKLNLQKPGCMSTSTIQHEVFHSLGVSHEQSRRDRDDYINIYWRNIKPGKASNFDKKGLSYASIRKTTKYNLHSLMHYGPKFFTKNGKVTMAAKDGTPFYGHNDLRREDILKLVYMYKYENSKCKETNVIAESKFSNPNCRDCAGQCPQWAAQGECNKGNTMMGTGQDLGECCARSCKKCSAYGSSSRSPSPSPSPSSCADKNANCPAWSRYCDNNDKILQVTQIITKSGPATENVYLASIPEHCPKTCNKC